MVADQEGWLSGGLYGPAVMSWREGAEVPGGRLLDGNCWCRVGICLLIRSGGGASALQRGWVV
jgi:hypothetical protein